MTELLGKQIALAAAKAAEDKKADDIQVLDVRDVMVDTDFFVICSATTMVQLRAITGQIIDAIESLGVKLFRHEGRNNNSWVLLDYGSVVVHVFREEERMYYSLEKLWADAKKVPVN